MSGFVRQVALLAVATVVSWWLMLRPPTGSSSADVRPPASLAVALLPRLERAMARPEQEQVDEVREPVDEPVQEAEPPEPESPEEQERAEEAPPPPELGDPEGDAGAEAPVASTPEEDPEEVLAESARIPEDEPAAEEATGPSAEELRSDPDLLADAEAELAGEVRLGFATDFLARPEDQLAIARHFGEELVLVPREALDPRNERPTWFRLDASGAVQSVHEPPPLERYRQYRDLFAYEYERLPAPLRALRRSVLSREEVYLFAALVPPSEWALVIGRRREALAAAGRSADEVRRFLLRYARRGDAFDVEVREIQFADGTWFRPGHSSSGG